MKLLVIMQAKTRRVKGQLREMVNSH
uniref:Uncharacterized protein n=1 Tax=Arundo donax TaxID=35708 RepID=A0A0A9AXX4_ARUDO